MNWKFNKLHRNLLILLVVLSAIFSASSRSQKFNSFKSFTDSETIAFSESFADSDELQDFQDGSGLVSLPYSISLKHIKIASFSSQIQSCGLQISFHCLPRSPPSV